VQRAAHWANATLFAILMLTALPLYFAAFSTVVGRRHLVAEIHLWAGIALPVPLLVALVGPWGARMRRDARRVNLWTRDEIRWLRTLGKSPVADMDKFNPGQKLNAIFIAGVILVMLATGSVMQWFRYFAVDWRTGATFVHDVFAWIIFIVVFGHIAFALSHPDSLRSMVRGWVTERWAARYAPGWLKELQAEGMVPRTAARRPLPRRRVAQPPRRSPLAAPAEPAEPGG
jgi:formate dehydrogenase subunit gamma